ncbi:MAG TPA: hypothetical protein VG326_08505 [Tepidisphaeraceae bacterium]|jgi:hypothetical protein|nr:hypothetical protein [Tepidisphaeraceae bacterium]
MNIQIPTADLKSTLSTLLGAALSSETQVGQSALSQLQALTDELYPLFVSETQAMLTASNPATPQAYLGILEGCIVAAAAKLGLSALSQQPTILAAAMSSGIQILVLLLKSAVVA